jgi:hypothetical protein
MHKQDLSLTGFMNKPAALCLLALTLGASISCEQQSYEETKMFNQSHKASTHHGPAHHDEKKEGGETHPAAAAPEHK